MLPEVRVIYKSTGGEIVEVKPSSVFTQAQATAEIAELHAASGQTNAFATRTHSASQLTAYKTLVELIGLRSNASSITTLPALSQAATNANKITERRATVRAWIHSNYAAPGAPYYRELGPADRSAILDIYPRMVARAALVDANLTSDTRWALIQSALAYSWKDLYNGIVVDAETTGHWDAGNMDKDFYTPTQASGSGVITATIQSTVTLSGNTVGNYAEFVIGD